MVAVQYARPIHAARHAAGGADPVSPASIGAELAGAAAAARASAVQRANHTGSQTSATISDFVEAVQDAVAGVLTQGTGVTLTYDDAANSLTVGAIGVDAEGARDAIGAALVGIGVISINVNDAADTITITSAATVNSTDAALRDRTSHTGVQAISTVSGLQAALDSKISALSYANAAPGSNFKVPFGTAARPSARTDIFFTIVGGTAADADPAWMVDYDDRLLTA